MTQADDLSRSLAAFDQNTTLIVVVEMSAASWLVAGMLPGVERRPREEIGTGSGRAVAAAGTLAGGGGEDGSNDRTHRPRLRGGRDGFWLVRWLRARGDQSARHSFDERRRSPASIVGRRPTGWTPAMLMRVFLGWLRGERGHCGMVAIPTLAEEDAKRPSRERENLVARAHPDIQPPEIGAGPARHPRLQADVA